MAVVTLEQAARDLLALTQQMNADELEVLGRFARKIIAGKTKHGAMNLDTDTRDWAVEIQEEMTDAACYMHMREIQYERRMNAGLKELAQNAPDSTPLPRHWLAESEGV